MDSGKIVVVDDEKIVTSAFKTLFMVEGFDNAAFFNNPKEDGFLKYFSDEGINKIEEKKLSDLN